jgi:hypothetical protein
MLWLEVKWRSQSHRRVFCYTATAFWRAFRVQCLPVCTSREAGLYMFVYGKLITLLSRSNVIMAWHIFRLQMEELTGRCRGQLQMNWISSHRQPTNDPFIHSFIFILSYRSTYIDIGHGHLYCYWNTLMIIRNIVYSIRVPISSQYYRILCWANNLSLLKKKSMLQNVMQALRLGPVVQNDISSGKCSRG